MIDIQDDPSVQQSIYDVAMISKSSAWSNKGPLPVLWTRIISPGDDLEADLESFALDPDKIDVEYDYEPSKKKTKKQWKPVFYSKDFW